MKYIYDYPRYKITCDIAVICCDSILIVQRGPGLEGGKWCLPGGNLNPEELLIDCAKRELWEETGISADKDMFQLEGIADDPKRAAGDRAISILYSLIYPYPYDQIRVGDDAIAYKFLRRSEIDNVDLAFDHKMLIQKVFDDNGI